jgi:hypothetical protein
MSKKTILVLANSVKHGQHCIAGKCIDTGRWVRPVSDENGAALNDDQAKCQNRCGKCIVKPREKVEIGIRRHTPLPNQPENYLIDDSTWQQRYTLRKRDLNRYIDSPADLWGAGDRVPFSEISNGNIKISQSLYLVRVQEINLFISEFYKRRASFKYNGIYYNLAVTDPQFDSIIQGEKEIQGIVCISIGSVFCDCCYKLIAAIF